MSQTIRKVKQKELLDGVKRVVVKVGSAVLTKGHCMNVEVMDNLAREISALHNSGIEVVLVSSGAVAAGRKRLGFEDGTDITLQEKQALAAVGQSHLMYIYDSIFERYGSNIAQLLLTHADLSHRERYLNFKNTLFSLFKMNVIPIINENDTVSTEELQFGDNDNLGALVTNLIEGDLFICLTDVDCLYTDNPESNAEAKPVRIVDDVTEEVENMAGNSKSSLGTGGMQSKISAVKKVAAGGGASIIGPGKKAGVLSSIFEGEEVGTLFMPKRKRLQGRKQWIAFVLKPKGQLFLDKGACSALISGGKSLLASGVVKTSGDYDAGDAVECIDEKGHLVAVGLAHYRSEDVGRILGAHSEEIQKILGVQGKVEVIHRDDLVLL